ncbi:MAG TPA: hypothetical protein VE980_25800 [Pyrinomonadaceae bacterium]|nr:hypothetical protein [Pyrinomonadaceae bacterium]
MTLLTQKFSKLVFAQAIRVVTLVLFLVLFAASAALGSFAYVANVDDQVTFTVTGTAVVTAVTHLPGGLTQLDLSLSGKATHLGDFTGPATRIEDHQGNFGSTSVLVGANGKDSVFLSVSGQFETSKDKCVITSTGTFTVTGGTGAFANATGGGTTFTRIDLCADTTSGAYTGTISRPNSN